MSVQAPERRDRLPWWEIPAPSELEAAPPRPPEIREEVRPPGPSRTDASVAPTPREARLVGAAAPPIAPEPVAPARHRRAPEGTRRAWGRAGRAAAIRRRPVISLVAAGVVVALVAVVAVSLLHRPGRRAPGPVHAVPPSSLAWAVGDGRAEFLTLIALPSRGGPVAEVFPGATAVDLPGGPATVGAAATDGREALAAMQVVLDRRVGFYLQTGGADLSGLVDRLGGVTVQTEAGFAYGGRTLGPGPVRLDGSQVLAYLRSATGTDDTGRWEDVLSALLSAPVRPGAWTGTLGASNGGTGVGRILQAANGAPVTELPTAQEALGLVPDPTALASLQARLGRAVGGLVRVVVENGNGAPGLGDGLQRLLAPHGFRVVASENLGRFDRTRTLIIAANDSFVPWANEVRALMGVGKVYVGRQATGIADVTVVVGKDYPAG